MAEKKTENYTFSAKGRRYALPPLTEEQAMGIPGKFTRDAIMNPDNDEVQIRLGFVNLEASSASEAAKKAFEELSTGEMLKVLGEWLGGSSGSSDSSQDTEEPSSTTGEPDSL